MKTYSVRKSKALPASQVTPFSENDTDHSDLTKTFLFNKLKHMKKLAHLKAALH